MVGAVSPPRTITARSAKISVQTCTSDLLQLKKVRECRADHFTHYRKTPIRVNCSDKLILTAGSRMSYHAEWITH